MTEYMIYPECDNKILFQVAFGCKNRLFVQICEKLITEKASCTIVSAVLARYS